MSAADLSKSLANTLAGANLTDDETNLLVTLIEGEQPEVEGFKATPKLTNFDLGTPPRIDQSKPDGWIDVVMVDWGIKPTG